MKGCFLRLNIWWRKQCIWALQMKEGKPKVTKVSMFNLTFTTLLDSGKKSFVSQSTLSALFRFLLRLFCVQNFQHHLEFVSGASEMLATKLWNKELARCWRCYTVQLTEHFRRGHSKTKQQNSVVLKWCDQMLAARNVWAKTSFEPLSHAHRNSKLWRRASDQYEVTSMSSVFAESLSEALPHQHRRGHVTRWLVANLSLPEWRGHGGIVLNGPHSRLCSWDCQMSPWWTRVPWQETRSWICMLFFLLFSNSNKALLLYGCLDRELARFGSGASSFIVKSSHHQVAANVLLVFRPPIYKTWLYALNK